jgi:hypothetical protein
MPIAREEPGAAIVTRRSDGHNRPCSEWRVRHVQFACLAARKLRRRGRRPARFQKRFRLLDHRRVAATRKLDVLRSRDQLRELVRHRRRRRAVERAHEHERRIAHAADSRPHVERCERKTRLSEALGVVAQQNAAALIDDRRIRVAIIVGKKTAHCDVDNTRHAVLANARSHREESAFAGIAEASAGIGEHQTPEARAVANRHHAGDETAETIAEHVGVGPSSSAGNKAATRSAMRSMLGATEVDRPNPGRLMTTTRRSRASSGTTRSNAELSVSSEWRSSKGRPAPC